METGIHNTSEIGRLRKVLLHRPGQELENLMPEYLERLLFDDIPYLKEAQAEHDAFAQCLRDAGVEVVYLIDLVVNSLTSPEVRQELVTQFLKEADLPDEAVGKAVAEYLSELDNRAMVSAMMAGIRRSDLRKQGGRLSDHLSGLEEGYPFAVDPMPNLYFTRDPFATIGTGVSIHKMHTVTRNRETLFGRFIFEHNPWYQNAPRWYDRSASSSLEGGDILVLSPQVLAVGISQRTEGDSIDQLAQTVLSQSKTFQKVLAFNIPKSRSFMHLDTVFTMVDRDKFTVHPNILQRHHRVRHGAGRKPEDENPSGGPGGWRIFSRSTWGLSQVTLIPCGQGSDIDAAREQWSDGSNTLAIAPGEVVVYYPELCHQPVPGGGGHPHPRHSQRRAEPGAGRSPVHEYAADPGRSVDRRRFAAGSAALPRRMHPTFSFETSNAPDWYGDVRRCRTGLNPHFLFVLPKRLPGFPAELYRFGTEKPGDILF